MHIKINPITGFGKTAVAIDLQAFSVDVAEKQATCHYVLLDEAGADVARGNAVISGDDYAKWGTDDAYAIAKVLTQADVTADETPEADPE